MPNRAVHHADAIEWLSTADISGCSIITSLPDISEFPKLSMEEWKSWFIETAAFLLSRSDPNGVVIFYQSDIKRDGIWIDKGFLCQLAGEKSGASLIAHKIICRAPVGTDTNSKTGYSHLLCFSKSPRKIEKYFADVFPDAGVITWTRGMGVEACKLACEMVQAYTNSTTVLDPFCGHGTVLAVANEMGLDAIGVDHKQKYTSIAQKLGI